jgi:hypothetical protein
VEPFASCPDTGFPPASASLQSHGSVHVGNSLLANLTFANFLHGNISGESDSSPSGGNERRALDHQVEVMLYLALIVI